MSLAIAAEQSVAALIVSASSVSTGLRPIACGDSSLPGITMKLLPPEGRDALPVKTIIRRLRDEFMVVDADPDAGQDHVAEMIAVTLKFSDSLPGKQERLAWLQSIQKDAVDISFGDDMGLVASCCVWPGSELFFGSPDAIYGAARPLLERAAKSLGYTVYDPAAEGCRRAND